MNPDTWGGAWASSWLTSWTGTGAALQQLVSVIAADACYDTDIDADGSYDDDMDAAGSVQ